MLTRLDIAAVRRTLRAVWRDQCEDACTQLQEEGSRYLKTRYELQLGMWGDLTLIDLLRYEGCFDGITEEAQMGLRDIQVLMLLLFLEMNK